MPFYEVVYETGRMSVAMYADDDEATDALQAHHARAVRGEPGGPIGQPAERITKVYKYKQHPDDYNPSQGMSADVLKTAVDAIIDELADANKVVSVDQVAVAVRGLTHPMTTARQSGVFGSVYRMPSDGELKAVFK